MGICLFCGHTLTTDGCSNSKCSSHSSYSEMGKVYNYVEASKKDKIHSVIKLIKSSLDELERLVNGG